MSLLGVVVDEYPSSQTGVKIANGCHMNIVGRVFLTIYSPNMVIYDWFYVCDQLSHPIILGTYSMKSLKMNIKLRHNTVQIITNQADLDNSFVPVNFSTRSNNECCNFSTTFFDTMSMNIGVDETPICTDEDDSDITSIPFDTTFDNNAPDGRPVVGIPWLSDKRPSFNMTSTLKRD